MVWLKSELEKKYLVFLKDFTRKIETVPTIIIFAHDNIDPDALGSISGVSFLIEHLSLGLKPVFMFKGTMSLQARKMMEDLSLDMALIDELPSGNFLPIIVDSQGYPSMKKKQENILKSNGAPPVIIDHHEPVKKHEQDVSLIDPSSKSNCEIIMRLMKIANITPSFQVARYLIAGMMFDTGFLRHASSESISVMSPLLDTGVDLDELRSLLRTPMAYSERMARVKGAMRAEITRINQCIIATTRVSSYEASVCRGLVSLGVDIALCLASNRGSWRISSRQTQSCLEEYCVDLARVMSNLAGALDCTGGGHSAAAASNGDGDGEQALEFAKKNIITWLKDGIRNGGKNKGGGAK
ncbi:hypothetical protein GF325_01655 [Candidatus Bathyarchaeota archaeon]|nr:hypothetical protein [Candidatus Bathyarchaeota archaeon]